jgi:biotin transport system substrate-specific component
VYIVLGLVGLPVFTQGGGPSYILIPTFGYIIGFCVGAYITGAIAHKASFPSLKRLLAANIAGLAAVYLTGMAYYYLISNFYLGNHIGLWTLFLYCFVLAVPGDIVLCLAAAKVSKALLPIVKGKGVA